MFSFIFSIQQQYTSMIIRAHSNNVMGGSCDPQFIFNLRQVIVLHFTKAPRAYSVHVYSEY